jgi:hypothetical protein
VANGQMSAIFVFLDALPTRMYQKLVEKRWIAKLENAFSWDMMTKVRSIGYMIKPRGK